MKDLRLKLKGQLKLLQACNARPANSRGAKRGKKGAGRREREFVSSANRDRRVLSCVSLLLNDGVSYAYGRTFGQLLPLVVLL